MKRPCDWIRSVGSPGDLATMLSLAVGMILFNGLNPGGLLLTTGMAYIGAGLYGRVRLPLEPMKVACAYAIATAMPPDQVLAAGLILSIVLLGIGAAGATEALGDRVPPAVIVGVQFCAGLLLMVRGLFLMAGTTPLQVLCQAGEPHLRVQFLGGVPVGIIIGLGGALLAVVLRKSRRLPAGLVVMAAGVGFGLILGTRDGLDNLRLGFYLPRWLPYGLPAGADLGLALVALALPQIPVTLHHALTAGSDPAAMRPVTPRGLCIGMGLANLAGFILGGMPLGLGDMKTRPVSGVLTARVNWLTGVIFGVLAILLGFHVLSLIHLLPLSILGLMLVIVGGRMTLAVAGLDAPMDRWVVLIMAGITVASNLAVALGVGVVLTRVVRWKWMAP